MKIKVKSTNELSRVYAKHIGKESANIFGVNLDIILPQGALGVYKFESNFELEKNEVLMLRPMQGGALTGAKFDIVPVVGTDDEWLLFVYGSNTRQICIKAETPLFMLVVLQTSKAKIE